MDRSERRRILFWIDLEVPDVRNSVFELFLRIPIFVFHIIFLKITQIPCKLHKNTIFVYICPSRSTRNQKIFNFILGFFHLLEPRIASFVKLRFYPISDQVCFHFLPHYLPMSFPYNSLPRPSFLTSFSKPLFSDQFFLISFFLTSFLEPLLQTPFSYAPCLCF